MKSAFAFAFVLVLAVSASAQIVPYWIPDDGCTLGYGSDGVASEWYQGRAVSLAMVYWTSDMPDGRIDGYSRDGDDLVLREQDYPGMETDTYRFDPPLRCLDMPLTMGKTWTSESVRSRVGGGTIPRTYVLTCTVIGPRTVETVLGPLDVIEVVRELTIDAGSTTVSTLLLHEQLGNVEGLASLTSCSTVGTERLSWAEVRGFYR